jgi:hypothetical protein
MAYTYPPIIINEYLKEKVSQLFNMSLPMFPSMPTNLDDVLQMFPDSNGTFAVYDRMFRMRKKSFPHIKCEQLLYYFYKTINDQDSLIQMTQHIYDLLDRGDESAEDINEWIRKKVVNGVLTIGNDEYLPVRFHYFKIYQLQETRDVVDFGTARTFAGNKIIVDYDYHSVGYSAGNVNYNGTQIN